MKDNVYTIEFYGLLSILKYLNGCIIIIIIISKHLMQPYTVIGNSMLERERERRK